MQPGSNRYQVPMRRSPCWLSTPFAASLLAAALLPGPARADASDAACDTSVRLTRWSPAWCDHRFDAERCSDLCREAQPELQPACFASLKLPCSLHDSLLESVEARSPGSTTVPIALLLGHPESFTALHVFQRALYDELYGAYVPPTTEPAHGLALRQLTRENYRLQLSQALSALTFPLVEAAAGWRMGVVSALSASTSSNFEHLLGLAQASPLHSAPDRLLLESELSSLFEQQLASVRMLESFPPLTVARARARYLGERMAAFGAALSALDPSSRGKLIARAAILDDWFPVGVRECEPGPICHASPSPDQILAWPEADFPYELLLEGLLAEAQLLGDPLELDHAISQSSAPVPIDLDRFSRLYTDYSQTPSSDALHRLEVAFAVASLQSSVSDRALFEALAAGSDATLDGVVTRSRVGSQRLLRCGDLDRIDPRVREIQREMLAVSRRFERWIEQLRSAGTRPADDEGRALAARADGLRREAAQLLSLERFALDRRSRVTWIVAAESGSEIRTLEVEYLSVHGLYWIPSMAIPPQELLPSVVELSTLQGSLLPGGQGQMAGAHIVQLTLEESPHVACQREPSARLVLRERAPDGVSRRLILTADLSPL
jgi:hypothetical protein